MLNLFPRYLFHAKSPPIREYCKSAANGQLMSTNIVLLHFTFMIGSEGEAIIKRDYLRHRVGGIIVGIPFLTSVRVLEIQFLF